VSGQPVYLDATMLYRWRHLAPVGIVRLERMLCSHLYLRSGLRPVRLVIWDSGYRLAEGHELAMLEQLMTGGDLAPSDDTHHSRSIGTPGQVRTSGRSVRARLRHGALKTLGRLPDNLRPFAEQAAWSVATFGVESARHVRRARTQRSIAARASVSRDKIVHRIDLAGGGDIVALGLGWEYLDHQSMYELKQRHGFRIHMPAFDLIPVEMPQLNAAQSDLVHRYYAEMAHYADTITSISHATTEALRRFYLAESLPVPELRTNQVPSAELEERDWPDDRRRHRLHGTEFVLSVSTVEIRKNHLLLAKIWRECAIDGITLPKLAIVGRIGWDVNELLRWVELAPELDDLVSIYSDVDDDELSRMYTDCAFTVFPSRIEGWGMPITEAMAYGKACIHATDPAQLEASQGLMPCFHPDDFMAWKHGIVRLATDAGYRQELESSIAERYVRRSIAEYCHEFERIIADRRAT